MRNILTAACVAVLLFSAGATASDDGIEVILDQYQLDGSEQNNILHATRSLGQTFLVGLPGSLAAIELSLFANQLDPTDELNIEVIDATWGPAGAPILGSTTVTASELGPAPSILDANLVTATLIDLSGLGIDISFDDMIGIRLSSTVMLPSGFVVRNSPSNPYPDGGFFSNDSDGGWAIHDLAFKTFVATEAIFLDGFESGDCSAWSSSEPPGEAPVADFTYSATGLQVYFQNQSTGRHPLSFLWDFGDGTSPSTDENPTHFYTSPGAYNVKLSVVNTVGVDSIIKVVIVTH